MNNELSLDQLENVSGGVTTQEQVYQVVGDYLDLDVSQILSGCSLTEDLGADRYDLLDIINKLGEIYNIRIPERDYARLQTPGDLIEYIQNHR